MIVDFRIVGAAGFPSATTVIIGAGAAGLAVALALGDRGRHVIVLESGGAAGSSAGADSLNDGTTGEVPYAGLVQGRARGLGGTTTLWHGQCMRLHSLDLAERPWVAGSGWPLTLDQLAAYYDAAERWLDVSGRGYGEQRWMEHPRLPPLPWDPEHLLHDFTEYTPQPSLAQRHRTRLRHHDAVHVVLNATATRILLDGERVCGVEVRGPDGQQARVGVQHLVVACGALESARLLQLSDPAGIGLGTGRQHTGRYLQDHPIIRTAEVLSPDYRVLQDRYVVLHRQGRRLFPKVRLAPTAQERHRLLDATAVFVHEHTSPALTAARGLVLAARARRRPERPLHDVVAALRGAVPVLSTAYRRNVQGLATAQRPAHVWLQLWLEQAPDPDRRVTLGAGRDALGLRQAHVDWSCRDQELETSRLMTRWIGSDLERMGVATLRELAPMRDDTAWRRSVSDAAHPAGTTRLSRSPREGVVDLDLQVHGTAGLYVVGGSVFPTSGYANPTLTIVALALRLAEHLLPAAGRPVVSLADRR